MPQGLTLDSNGGRLGTRGRPTDGSGQARPLAPKEHGAYGQLGFPLLVAMLLGRPTLSGGLLVVASVVAFIAHEPLVLLLGQRGKKALREDSARAKRKLITLAALGCGLGLGALWLGTTAVRFAMLANCIGVAIALGFVWRGRERSLLGELWVSLTLPLAALPVALANGLPLTKSLALVGSFVIAYAAGIFGVRGIIAEFKRGERRAGLLGLSLLMIPLLALAWRFLGPGLAAAMYWSVVVVARLLRPSPKSLKPLGWCLVFASLVQSVWLVVVLT